MEENIRKQCRTCLRQHNSRTELVSLFDYDETFANNKIKFSDMLFLISNHEVSPNDLLPKRVCIVCLSQIRTSYYFRDQVQKSYESLLTQLNLTNSQMIQNNIKVKEEPKLIPMILSPRHVGDESFSCGDNDDELLVEIERHDTDEEIIDYGYEPEVSDDDSSTFANEPPVLDVIENNSKKTDAQNNKNEQPAKHTRSQHEAHKCTHCNQKCFDGNELEMHTRSRHPEKLADHLTTFKKAIVSIEKLTQFIECHNCCIKFASREAAYRHHYECDNKCAECGLKILRKENYYLHMESVHGIKLETSSFECPFCMIKYDSQKILEDHIQKIHPEENGDSMSETCDSNDGFSFNCEMCPASFGSFKSLKHHKGIKHKDQTKSPTKNKNVPKYSRDEFIEKFLVKKSKDTYHCTPCGKEYGKSSVMVHLRSKHASVRSFRCEFCPEAFFRGDYRQRHVLLSHPNKLRCHNCNLSYDRTYKYDSHMQIYHNVPVKNFKPDEKKDTFDLSPSLIKYIENMDTYDYTDDYLVSTRSDHSREPSVVSNATTTETPLNKDEFCEKYLNTISEKASFCTVCQQEIQKCSIISHLLWKHAVDRPLKCSFCNERVVKNNARLLHMSRCHPNEYKCPECSLQFAKHYSIVEHMRDFHKKKCDILISSGEEDDLTIADLIFVTNKNDDEVIENTEIMNTNDSEERKFECVACNRKFSTLKNLSIHKTHKHRTGIDQNLPNTSSSSSTSMVTSNNSDDAMTFDEFRNNWIEDINDNVVKCLVCEFKVKKKNLSTHLKNLHCTTGAYLCEICRESFYSPERRLQHMTAQHKGMYFCYECNIQFCSNSRYVNHMKEVHEVELMDSKDRFDVDLNVNTLRFFPTIRKNLENDQSLTNSFNDDNDDADPIEAMISQLSNGDENYQNSNNEEFTRNEFILKYFTNINKDMKHCSACNKTFQASSIYHHLIHVHITILPYKCPFCDLRFERSTTRARHMQLCHPNEYTCKTCGIQFQKYLKFADHMIVEHNITELKGKSPLEEEDISNTDARYVVNKQENESIWQEEESNSFSSSSMISCQPDISDYLMDKNDHFLKPLIKREPNDNQSTLETIQMPTTSGACTSIHDESLPYHDFKTKYMRTIDSATQECIPCKRTIIKTSVAAHLRLWHSKKTMFNCELCSQGFRRQDYRSRHMQTCHPKDYFCSHCCIQFHRSVLYVEHMRNDHKTKIILPELKQRDEIDVPLEKMYFSSKLLDLERLVEDRSVVKMKRRHSMCDERPINPDAGGTTFIQFCNQYIIEKNDMFYCVVCNQSLTKLSIKKHVKKIHSTSPPYVCELCDQGFQTTFQRTIHMQVIHPSMYNCNDCKKQFYYSGHYNDHMRTCHDQTENTPTLKELVLIDVPFERIRFSPKKQFEVISNNIAPFDNIPDDAEMTREQFSKKFFRIIRNQKGERETKCLSCDKTFSQNNRYFHILQHHAIKRPFGCEFCDFRFFSAFKRMKHMELKHNENNRCSVCNMQFVKLSLMNEHIRDVHNIKVQQEEDEKEVDIPTAQLKYSKKSTSVRTLKGMMNSSLQNNEDFASVSTQDLKCSICEREFNSSRSYRKHIRDHSIFGDTLPYEKSPVKLEPPPPKYDFACDLCEKKFIAIFALNAHKKFKHGINSDGSPVGIKQRSTTDKQKFETECDMCDFKTFRRDYVEHHTGKEHKGEFQCHFCDRTESDYNHYIYHLVTQHPKCKLKFSQYKQCLQCPFDKYFKFEENLQKHIQSKHEKPQAKKEFFCEYCNLNYFSKASYEVHIIGHKHKAIKKFFDDFRANKHGSCGSSSNVKNEKEDEQLIEIQENSADEEPVAKRTRLDVEITATSEEDKLDYLKYLQHLPDGTYKCGICGKPKSTRKFLLHHLKQHSEIPTFNCTKCPERFVFKRKFEKHLLLHERERKNEEMEIIENEHPKFQEIKIAPTEIRCAICNVSFKLTIQFNKHNTTWHADDNPSKNLSMQEQKNKTKEFIKILRCKHCTEAFMKSEDLKEHQKNAHNIVIDENNESKFVCKMCNLQFKEKQFLENHLKLFCVHRNVGNGGDQQNHEIIAVNEQ